jgi:hypothetical protein
MCKMIHPLFSALHPKMAEVYQNRLKKNSEIGFSWKWSSNQKWFLIFFQILSYVKK